MMTEESPVISDRETVDSSDVERGGGGGRGTTRCTRWAHGCYKCCGSWLYEGLFLGKLDCQSQRLD